MNTNIMDVLTSNTYAEAIRQITGVKPQLIYTDNVTYVRFTPDQQKQLRAWVRAQLSKKRAPGTVKIEFEPVLFPILLEKGIPIIILLLLIGAIIGRKI